MGTTNIFLGTELKLNVNIEPMGEFTMEDYDFSVDIWTSMKRVATIHKSECIKIDKNNYVVLVDTNLLGAGDIKAKVIANIPDFDFPDTVRTEVVALDLGITVLKML